MCQIRPPCQTVSFSMMHQIPIGSNTISRELNLNTSDWCHSIINLPDGINCIMNLLWVYLVHYKTDPKLKRWLSEDSSGASNSGIVHDPPAQTTDAFRHIEYDLFCAGSELCMSRSILRDIKNYWGFPTLSIVCISKGPKSVGVSPLIWGGKQIQAPKRCVF
jgi:hypothetical protein